MIGSSGHGSGRKRGSLRGGGESDAPYLQVPSVDDGGFTGAVPSSSPVATSSSSHSYQNSAHGGSTTITTTAADDTAAGSSGSDGTDDGGTGNGNGGGNKGRHPVLRHLSMMADEGMGTDNGYGDNEYLLPPRWIGRCRRAAVLLTVAAGVVAAILYADRQSRRTMDDSAAHHPPPPPPSPPVGGSASCGTFLEPDPIMALKNTSAVEGMKYGAVASDNAVCSDVGVSILRDLGGNAVDAAVATALCLGVVNPASSGMGGGAMILVHTDADGDGDRGVDNRNHVVSTPPLPFNDERTSEGGQIRPKIMQAPTPRGEGVGGDGGERRVTDDKGEQEDRQRQGDRLPVKKVTEFIDCREVAPAASTYDMYENLDERASVDGGLAVGVPGELRGLELLHSRHGSLPWSDVVQPAAVLAEEGFIVRQRLAHDIETSRKKILQFENLAHVLTKDNDGKTLLREGDTMRQPALAETLRDVMERGSDAIYRGARAEQIAKDVRDAGGILTSDDLNNYRPALRDPLVAHDVLGFTMVGAPPPSSGGACVIGAARILAGYAAPYAAFADTLSRHRLVEASKNVFAIRMSLSDPAFDKNVTMRAVADLVTGAYMEELRRQTRDDGEVPLSWYGGGRWAKLNDVDVEDDGGELQDAQEGDRLRQRRATEASLAYGDSANHGQQVLVDDTRMDRLDRQSRRKTRLFGYLEDHGTTHLSVIDKDRNAVAITSTVNTYFGSGIVSPTTGLFLNNQMDDFATPGQPNYFGLEPSKSNYIAPGKTPLSSMSPTLVFQPQTDASSEGYDSNLGEIFMVLGASGGPKIISAVLQTFVNHALLGMPLYESVVDPRLHDQLLYHGKAVTTYEECPLLQGPTIEVTDRTISALSRRGQRLLAVNYMGTVQAVAVDPETDTLSAVSDIRKGGSPSGY